MAQYIKQEMNALNGESGKQVYYRMKIERNLDMDGFVERVAHDGSGLSRASVLHVMEAVADQLARCMAEGQSVTIEGIGTFKPRLGVVKGKELDAIDATKPQRNAQSIEVNGVHFRTDKKLVRKTNRHCTLTRGGISRIKHSSYTEEERLTLALNYLNEHVFMHVSDYMKLTGLKRTSATMELKQFSRDPESGIDTEGRGSHRVYVRRKESNPSL